MPEQSIPAPIENQPQPAEYRDIAGFPGYRVGDDGSVWSCWRRTGPGGGSVLGSQWRRLKPGPQRRSGHLHVCLSRNRRQYTRLVHRLILEAFVGPCPPGMECRHFPDHDPANNCLSNLVWGTVRENSADRVAHGTDNRGERNNMAKLSAATVRAILKAAAEGETKTGIANRLGVSRPLVSMVVWRKRWKHLNQKDERVTLTGSPPIGAAKAKAPPGLFDQEAQG